MENTGKKASFRGLLFREFYLSKDGLIWNTILFVIVVLFNLLFLLSIHKGNLRMLFELVKVPGQQLDFILDGTSYSSALFIGMISSSLLMGAVSGSVKDANALWRRFQLSLPVKPWKMALAKYIILLFALAESMAFLGIHQFCYAKIDGRGISPRQVGLAMLAMTMMLLFSILFQLLVLLLHSGDKAGLVLTGILILAIVPVGMLDGMEVITLPEVDFEMMCDFAAKCLPIFPLIMTGSILLGYAGCCALLARREK